MVQDHMALKDNNIPKIFCVYTSIKIYGGKRDYLWLLIVGTQNISMRKYINKK